MDCNRREFGTSIIRSLVIVVAACQIPGSAVGGEAGLDGLDMAVTPATLSLVPKDDRDSWRVAVGRRLRKAREASQMSQDDVAHLLGVVQGSISNYETGANSIPSDHLYRMCQIYHSDSNEIMGLPSRDTKSEQRSQFRRLTRTSPSVINLTDRPMEDPMSTANHVRPLSFATPHPVDAQHFCPSCGPTPVDHDDIWPCHGCGVYVCVEHGKWAWVRHHPDDYEPTQEWFHASCARDAVAAQSDEGDGEQRGDCDREAR